MSIKNNSWVSINNDSVNIADFKTIRNDILNEIIEIYNLKKEDGTSLEIPEYSEDYIFSNNLALGIWNSLQVIESVFLMHNLDFATERYLDKIMGYYGYYRQQGRRWVIEVELQGLDQLAVAKDSILVDKNGSGYEFNFVAESSKGVNSSKYIYRASDFYWDLTRDKLKNLSLVSAEQDLNSVQNGIKILVNQKREENDEEFKNRFENKLDFNNRLVNEIKKVQGVNDVFVLSANDRWKTKTLNYGELCVLINFNNEYKALSEEEQNNLKIDIEILISEYTPLGFKLIALEENDTNNVKKLSSIAPLNDFVEQDIIINEIIYNNGAIGFNCWGVSKDEIDGKCLDLINTLNNRNIFFNYNYNDAFYYVSQFFNVSKNELFYALNNANTTPLSLKTWNYNTINNIKIYDFDSNLLQLQDANANVITFNNLTSLNVNDIDFKWYLKEYKYNLNEDGTYSVILF